MATYTPKPRGSVRPSTGYSNTSNSPSLNERLSTNMHRKASLNALTGVAPMTPAAKSQMDDFNVGDVVNVPGDMFGTVKFIGSVRGKAGRFLGVELDGDFAARGKNNGDVDGVSYFNTDIPGAGIFLPVHRAQRRFSLSAETPQDSSPLTGAYNKFSRSPGTPSIPKFAQTVGPGARPPSPQFKPKSRPSLPRPESPLRRAPPPMPTPGRQFSQSVRPGSKPPLTPSVARSATPKLSASIRGGPPPARPYSRTASRLGTRPESRTENPMRSPSRLSRPSDELATLRVELAEKDRQLSDQTAQLLEMESALKELQTLLPNSSPLSSRRGSRISESDGIDVPSLRRALKEKNDRINALVAEFDAHRVDFRSTIETLELASDETVRVYEARVSELMAEVAELKEHAGPSQEEVVLIAGQLKDLEDLVAELEEGLEDARRGEAEARGEVEFLRGEVERGRSELRREREKATEQSGAKDRDHELAQKDEEILALQQELHEMRAQHDAGAEKDEVERLREEIERLALENKDLEARLKHADSPATTPEKPAVNGATKAVTQEEDKWCALCEQDGHLAFDCPNEQY